jgi:hypothetical protein
MRHIMHTVEQPPEQEFWSDVYCGRPIAILNHYGRWHVYLDHVLQQNILFATPDDAIMWLMIRIDRGIPGRLH